MRNIKQTEDTVAFPKKERVYAAVSDPLNPFVYATVGMTYPDPSYRIDRNAFHRINVFEWVLEGEGEILLDGEWRSVKSDCLYILRAGEEHHYRSNSERPWKKIWINYTADYTCSLLDSVGICSGIYAAKDAYQYFDLAMEAAKNNTCVSDAAWILSDCVHKLIRLAAKSKAEREHAEDCGIRDALGAGVYQKIDLSALSEQLHMSRSNMIRIFKRCYGITPYEYLLRAKMEAAKSLLCNTQLSVQAIAQKLCISDEHYFSTLFYNRVGMRPRDFRKSGGFLGDFTQKS